MANEIVHDIINEMKENNGDLFKLITQEDTNNANKYKISILRSKKTNIMHEFVKEYTSDQKEEIINKCKKVLNKQKPSIHDYEVAKEIILLYSYYFKNVGKKNKKIINGDEYSHLGKFNDIDISSYIREKSFKFDSKIILEYENNTYEASNFINNYNEDMINCILNEYGFKVTYDYRIQGNIIYIYLTINFNNFILNPEKLTRYTNSIENNIKRQI